MSVVYMTRDTGSIPQEGNRLIIKENGTFLTGMPIKNAEGIVVTSNASISSKVIHTMLKQGSYIVFTDWQGRYEGILCASRSNLKMVNMQMTISNMKLSLQKKQQTQPVCPYLQSLQSAETKKEEKPRPPYESFAKNANGVGTHAKK